MRKSVFFLLLRIISFRLNILNKCFARYYIGCSIVLEQLSNDENKNM